MKKRHKCKSISEYLRTYVAKLGRKIGQHPYYFIIVPCIMCALLSIGLMNTKSIGDNNYLLVPDSGKIYEVKRFIDRTFPFNTSEFYDFQRLTHRPKTAAIYIKDKNNGNMLQKNILLEIQSLNQIVRNVTVYADGRQISYKDICGMTHGKCFENPIFGLLHNLDDVISRRLKFKYPIDIDPLTFTYKVMFLNVGGVTLDADGYINEVSVLRLLYPLDENNSTKMEWNVAWTETLFNRIKEHNFKYIETFLEPFTSSEYEAMLNTQNSKSLISVTIIVVCIFCILSNMTNSWTRSKPWMGVASIISTGMAVIASFGLLFACGVENIIYNIAIPFVILATEIDDTFVVIACWRTSNIYDRVEKRMEDTYSNAAVSITITSLTNFCSYCVAMNSPFPGVRIFCAYAATCICFSYFFQLTFVGGCLALSGYREENGLHPFTLKPVKDFNLNYCTNEDIEQHDIFMKFFRNKVAKFISHSLIQIIIILLYIITLSLGIWGIVSLNEGFNVFGFFPENSEITQAFRIYYKYFTEYPFSIHIVINETLDYSNPVVQKSVENILEKFESHPNVADMDVSWLKYYKAIQNSSFAKYSFIGYDLSIKQDFIDALREVYLKFPGAKMYENDIVFNNNYTEITCSRFFLLARDVSNRTTEIKIINDLQKIAEESSFSVVVHTMISPIVEQGIIIKADPALYTFMKRSMPTQKNRQFPHTHLMENVEKNSERETINYREKGIGNNLRFFQKKRTLFVVA
ncbi:patched domain-containing protein 3-like [Centruroides vittatus]|uniref:patched domain-containing protein 3-like n=1 Tax=Centruroides vittatus TaxID=120091 RepID=UPI00350F34A7